MHPFSFASNSAQHGTPDGSQAPAETPAPGRKLRNRTKYIALKRASRPAWLSHIAAVLIVALAAAVRIWSTAAPGTQNDCLIFFPAVVIASLFVGLTAGLLATVLSVFFISFWWMERAGQFPVFYSTDWLCMVIFVVCCMIVSYLSEVVYRDRLQAGETGLPGEPERVVPALRDSPERLHPALESGRVGTRYTDPVIDEPIRDNYTESEERLRLSLEAINDGVWDWNIQTGSTVFSPRCYTMLGYEPNEIPQSYEAWKSFIHPEDAERVQREIDDSTVRGGRYRVEMRMRTKAGGWRWLLKRGAVVERDEHGNPIRMVGTHTDITERKKMEKELREREAHFRLMFDQSPVGTVLASLDYRFRRVNEAYCRMLGYSEQELLALRFTDITHPDDLPANLDLQLKVMRGEIDCFKLEKRCIRKNGTIIWVAISVRLMRDCEGNPIHFIALAEDITERKQAETALRESEERLALAVEATRLGMFDWNIIDETLLWTPHHMAIFGYPPADGVTIWTRKEWKDRVHPDDLPRIEERVRKSMADRTLFEAEYRIIWPDGSIHWIDGRGTYYYDSDGRATRMLGTVRDITGRKKSEEALLESEERFRKIFEDGPLGMAIVSRDCRFTKVNNKLCRLLGYSRDELTGSSIADVTPAEDIEGYLQNLERLYSGEVPGFDLEKRYLMKDGKTIWVHLTATSIRDEEGIPIYYLAMIEDITRRKMAEEELQRSEERLKILFEFAPDPYYLIDLEGNFVDANKDAEDAMGYSRKELVGKKFTEAGLLPPGEVPKMVELLARNGSGMPSGPDEFTLNRGDGRQVNLEVRTFPTLIRGQTLVLGIARDITERKRMEDERQKIERQLHQAQKMEAIGTLAGGIAHDFNNILSAIIGYSELALTEVSKQEPIADFIDQILKSGYRARDLVKQILEFSQQGKQEKKHLKLGGIVLEVLKLLKATIPSSIDIRTNIETDSDWIFADATKIHQLLMNLCTNAWHAMRQGVGTLRIDLKEALPPPRLRQAHKELKPGPYLKLEVSDTGHGMTREIMERIFDPYFTTKGTGEGTGLGLAVVQGIIKEHGGAITVDSKPGKGSTFSVFLPEMTPIAEGEEQEKPEVATGHEHVLYVDDEPALVELGKRMLERLGYRVTAFTSSFEALEKFRADPDLFELVITDLAMPQMRGTDLAKEIRKIRSEIPIIMCTGYTQELDDDSSRAIGISALVLKPIIIRELAASIKKARGIGGRNEIDLSTEKPDANSPAVTELNQAPAVMPDHAPLVPGPATAPDSVQPM